MKSRLKAWWERVAEAAGRLADGIVESQRLAVDAERRCFPEA